MQALLDVLDAFKPVLGFQLDIVLDGHLFVVDQLGDLLGNLFAAELRSLESCLKLLLPVLNLLPLLLQLLLLGHFVFIEVLINDVELLVDHDVEPLLRLVDDLIELVLHA